MVCLSSRTRDAFERVSVRDWLKRSFDCTRRCTLVQKMASNQYNLSAHMHMYILCALIVLGQSLRYISVLRISIINNLVRVAALRCNYSLKVTASMSSFGYE